MISTDHTKSLGVLTSGGDASGMNVAVRAVARTALRRGVRVLAAKRVDFLGDEADKAIPGSAFMGLQAGKVQFFSMEEFP